MVLVLKMEKIRITALDVMRELVCDLEYYWNNAKAQIGGEWWDSPTDEMRTIYSDTPESEKDKIIRAFGKDYVIFKGEEK